MASLQTNIKRMIEILSRRKLALRGGVSDKTIRNWENSADADTGNKIKSFAQKMNLPRSQLLGEQEIPQSWWDEFRESCRDTLRENALDILKRTPSNKMSDEQRSALSSFVSSFKPPARRPDRAS